MHILRKNYIEFNFFLIFAEPELRVCRSGPGSADGQHSHDLPPGQRSQEELRRLRGFQGPQEPAAQNISGIEVPDPFASETLFINYSMMYVCQNEVCSKSSWDALEARSIVIRWR